MSNHFPVMPANYLLAGVDYSITFPTPTSLNPDLTFTGVTSIPTGPSTLSSGNSLWQFVFGTPGNTGTFDQDVAETAVKALLTDLCQFLADTGGVTLAAVQSQVTMRRRWTWANATGDTAAFTDTVVYP